MFFRRSHHRIVPWIPLALCAAFVAGVGCRDDGENQGSASGDEGGQPPDLISVFDQLPAGVQRTLEPWTGDLPGMLDRRIVRVLTVYEPQFFGFDGRRQVGTVAEGAALLEDYLNDLPESDGLPVHVLIVPIRRDLLLQGLLEGRGDIAVAGLTITDERLEEVDFTEPVATGISELVVTGPDVEAPDRVEDLGSLELYVRSSSSFWESLTELDRQLRENGHEPLRLKAASEFLDDSDLLELVSAGSIPATVVADYQAEFWSQVFPDLVLQPQLTVRSGTSIGWALRKDSPVLRQALNEFLREHSQGTLLGNIIIRRYMQDPSRVVKARQFKYAERLGDLRDSFRRYGEQYDLDWVLLAAQAFQESRFDNSVRSDRGARGIMQLMPDAASEVGVEDISTPDGSIHAGAAYLRRLIDRYFDDPDLDALQRQLFAVAGYNAGPVRIQNLRQKTAAAGLDPDTWFNNVEILAAREIGPETVTYVSNVVKYYVTFSLVQESQTRREQLNLSPDPAS